MTYYLMAQHPTKLETERILKAAGFSCRQAKKLLTSWKLIVGEDAAKEEETAEKLDNILERLKALENK